MHNILKYFFKKRGGREGGEKGETKLIWGGLCWLLSILKKRRAFFKLTGKEEGI